MLDYHIDYSKNKFYIDGTVCPTTFCIDGTTHLSKAEILAILLCSKDSGTIASDLMQHIIDRDIYYKIIDNNILEIYFINILHEKISCKFVPIDSDIQLVFQGMNNTRTEIIQAGTINYLLGGAYIYNDEEIDYLCGNAC